MSFITDLAKSFSVLKNTPTKENELSYLIRDSINNYFENESIKCDKVFINSEGSMSIVPAIVIPKMPDTDILNVDNIKIFDLEINLNIISDCDYNYDEAAIWLIHEICENIITDNTLIRFKKNLINYYDRLYGGIKSVMRSIGLIAWIGVFSRTKKYFIDNTSTCFFSNYLRNNNECIDTWNSALSKYVSLCGGDVKVITDEYIEFKDKSDFMLFNKLARVYAANELKYNDTSYSTFVNYIISLDNSKLLKFYIEKEPKQLALYKGKEIFGIFDDTKILYESTESDLLESKKPINYTREYSELELDVNNVITTSDKIRTAVKLKEFLLSLEKELESNILNKDPILVLKDKTDYLVHKLSKINTEPTIIDDFI